MFWKCRNLEMLFSLTHLHIGEGAGMGRVTLPSFFGTATCSSYWKSLIDFNQIRKCRHTARSVRLQSEMVKEKYILPLCVAVLVLLFFNTTTTPTLIFYNSGIATHNGQITLRYCSLLKYNRPAPRLRYVRSIGTPNTVYAIISWELKKLFHFDGFVVNQKLQEATPLKLESVSFDPQPPRSLLFDYHNWACV